jgi:hypothetical protein
MTSVTYTVLIDDQDVADGLRRTAYRLSPSQIPDGPHAVSISATDPLQQTTDSSTAELLIDRTPPKVSLSVRRGFHRLRIRVNDGRRGQVSGVSPGSSTVKWGDGNRSTGGKSLSHRYKRGGRYRLRISVADVAGNHKTVTVTVRA